MTNIFDKVIKTNKVLSEFDGRTVLVTGATGTIGGAAVELFARYNDCFGGRVDMVCPARDMARVPRGLLERADVRWVEYDPTRDIDFDFDVDYVIHCAAPTKSKFMVENPVDTIDAIYGGTKRLLEYFRRHGRESFLYVSSVEVYGDNFDETKVFDENSLGTVDQLAVRSCYPEAKRLTENLCVAYAKQYNMRVNSARLSQIIGAAKGDNRLIAYFCDCARNKEQIVLKSDGKATKAYCAIADCASAMTYILARGENTAYNVSNPDLVYSVRALAEYVSEKFIGKKVVVQNLDSDMYPRSSYLVIDSSRLTALGWKPIVGIDEAFKHLIEEEV